MRKFFQFYSNRINILSIVILSISFIIILSFFQIQILNYQEIKNKVNKIAFKSQKIKGNRGAILDRNNKQLSLTINKYDFWVNTNKSFDKDKIIDIFSKNFNKPDSIYIKLLNKKSNYVKIEKNILFTDCKKIIDNLETINGLNIEKKNKRFYPYNNLACQTIGYVDLEGSGKSGIEKSLNTILSGDTTMIKLKKGAKGKFHKGHHHLEMDINGKDITLTIDIEIQNILQEELKNAVNMTQAESANGIIIDPSTGDILAIASIPDFNPNNYYNYNLNSYKNRTISDSYEPGSTLKIIPLISSMKYNYDIENKKYFCENGSYNLTHINKLNDHEAHDSLSIKDIFIHSSNIGISKIVNEMNRKDIYRLCLNFGFGTKTGLPFKSESGGKLRSIPNWSKTSKTYISIGQEIGVTNVQLALAYSAIANGGFLLKPHIIKSINNNQKNIYSRKVTPIRQVFNSNLSDTILNILKDVVDNGTAKNLNLNGYNVGGKTGTAQKFINGEYSSQKFISSFASIFPINNPEFVIIISIDSPIYGKHWSNESAVPVSKNIINRLIIMDKEYNPMKNQKLLLQKNNSKHKNKRDSITAQTFEKKNLPTMPNLIGKTLRSALYTANLSGVRLEPVGLSGKIIWQSIKPGKKIENNSNCKVKLSL